MPEIETINYRDAETNDEAAVIVRTQDKAVGLCVTLRSDGDIETFMSIADAARLIKALQKAIEPQMS